MPNGTSRSALMETVILGWSSEFIWAFSVSTKALMSDMVASLLFSWI